MKVSEVGKNNDIASTKAKKSAGGVSFASYLNNITDKQTQPLSGINNLSGVDAIFAAQMADNIEEKEKRKKLIKKAYTLLDCLTDIRDALLVGQISMQKLIDISRLVKEQKEICEDKKLLDIIAEIELRVEVELAKLTK